MLNYLTIPADTHSPAAVSPINSRYAHSAFIALIDTRLLYLMSITELFKIIITYKRGVLLP